MDIRDAMAEAILRDVLANPGKYRPEIVRAARENEELWHGYQSERTGTYSWEQYILAIKEYGLPPASGADQLPEQKCEDNGDQKPDAQDFK